MIVSRKGLSRLNKRHCCNETTPMTGRNPDFFFTCTSGKSWKLFFTNKSFDKAYMYVVWNLHAVAAPFFVGASRVKNKILRGQKSKDLPKMADFGIFSSGGASGGRASDWGANAPMPPLMPPLPVRTYNKRMLIAQDCVKFPGRIAWQSFLLNNLTDFLDVERVKKSRFCPAVGGVLLQQQFLNIS